MNRVCTILGIEKPIIQGPMAWTSTAPLVAAVSNAGGLGVLGVGFAPIGFVLEQVKATRALTQKPFAINVIMDPASGILPVPIFGMPPALLQIFQRFSFP